MPAQVAALEAAQCDAIYEEVLETSRAQRRVLEELLCRCSKGDRLVVWRLDRLGRSLEHLIDTVNALTSSGVTIQSLCEPLELAPHGVSDALKVFQSLGTFQQCVQQERRNTGLHVARARGRKGGRPRAMSPQMIRMASLMMRDPNTRVPELCEMLGVSKPTLYRYVGPKGEIRQ